MAEGNGPMEHSHLGQLTHPFPLWGCQGRVTCWDHTYIFTASLFTGAWVRVVKRWGNQILCPLLLICQKWTFCATTVTIASQCAHLSTAYFPPVYWALNSACYLWQIYYYIHYSRNRFRQKLRGAQRKRIIQNNYTIKRLYQNTVIQHRNEMKDTGRNNGRVLVF